MSTSTPDPVAPDLPDLPGGWDRALVVVAHPDDIEWGAAPAVAAWTAAGRDVAYVLVTRGEAGIAGLPPSVAGAVREEEQRAAGRAVGVDDITFLDHQDGRIEEGLGLRRDLAAVIRRARPELVVTMNPSERWGAGPGAPWNSADHRAVGRAVLDAVADTANEWIFPELLELAPWAGTRWVALTGTTTPTHAVDVGDHLDAAVASLAAHDRYLAALDPAPPAEQAAAIVERSVRWHADRRGGRPTVAFEVLAGPAAPPEG